MIVEQKRDKQGNKFVDNTDYNTTFGVLSGGSLGLLATQKQNAQFSNGYSKNNKKKNI